MPRTSPSKLEHALSSEHLAEFQAQLGAPGCTVAGAVRWLRTRGYRLSRTAVSQYKGSFEQTLSHVRQSAEVASSVANLVRAGGGTHSSSAAGATDAADVSRSALERFEQILMERISQISIGEEVPSGELLKIASAMKAAAGTRQTLDAARAAFEARQQKAVKAAKRTADAGGSGAAVAAKVAKLLGVSP